MWHRFAFSWTLFGVTEGQYNSLDSWYSGGRPSQRRLGMSSISLLTMPGSQKMNALKKKGREWVLALQG